MGKNNCSFLLIKQINQDINFQTLHKVLSIVNYKLKLYTFGKL